MIFQSAVRDKNGLLDSMSMINCHGEVKPHMRIEPAVPELQIRCSPYWANSKDLQLIWHAIMASYICLICYLLIINPFPHTAILQQTTFRKIKNVSRNEIFFKLESFENILQEQFLPLPQCFQMLSAACKNEYLWSKVCLITCG